MRAYPHCILILAALFVVASSAIAQDTGVTDAGAPDAGDESGESDAGLDGEASPSEPNQTVTNEAVTTAQDEPEEEPLPPGADRATGIRGRVIDSATSQPLPMAPVIAQGQSGTHSALTEEDGSYRLFLPPGRYVLRSYYDLYHGASFPRVRVLRGRFTERTLVLDALNEEAEVAVDEVEVTYRADASGAAATQALQQEAAGVQDLASAEALSEAGASDASDGARQVAGVTISNNQPIIRGLGGQFVAVLLNGTPVPSTDPDRPGVDLDLFPTSIIQNLAVLKTMTSDMTASWAGGVVDIRTVQFPREFTLELGLSGGVNTLTTFQQQLDYDGGSADFTGFDTSRSLPSTVPNRRLQLTRGGDLTADEINGIGASFENEWQYRRETALPNMGFGATLGNSHSLGAGRRFGYLLTLGYANEQRREVGTNRSRPTVLPDGTLGVFNDFDAESGVDEVGVNVLGTASVDLTDSSLSFLSIFNRSTSDEVERLIGTSAELAAGEVTERWQLRYTARTLFFSQLRGDHRNLGRSDELRLRWSAYAGLGRRDEPDRRTVVYGPQGGGFRWLEKASSGERFFSDLDQRDAGANVSLRFPLWSLPAGEARGTVGGGYGRMDRSLINRRFRMLQEQPPPPDQTVYAQHVEDLFSSANLGELTRFREFTSATDSYEANQSLYSLFANLETPIAGALSLVVGGRLEVFEQSVASSDPFSEEAPDPAMATDRVDIDVLPAASLKYALRDDMNLRAAYSMTVVRPQIRQLAPYQYYDFQRDRNLIGNPNLERMRVQNADLRWEWFFSESERVTFSVFYKQLNDFIYPQIRDPSTFATQMINADEGYVVGGEVELAFDFERVHSALSDFSFYGNFTLVHSNLTLPEELSGAVADEIRIPGQAPYVVNLSLRYDGDGTAFAAALSYNVVGSRITDVGVLNAGTLLPNIEQSPFHRLDFVASYEPLERLKIKLKCRNLLFQTQRYRMGEFIERTVRPGASFQLGLEYSY
ncbi:MAG: TonB-dependent receptor [Polyangiales bacterium]